MPTMELTSTNQQFAAAAADLIELKGLAKRQYYDKWNDCYCTLGAFRIQVFGYPEIEAKNDLPDKPKVDRYLELVDWFADQIGEPDPNDGRNSETLIGMWNDASSKEGVVTKLREAGRAA